MNKSRNSVDGFIPRRSNTQMEHAKSMGQRSIGADESSSLTKHGSIDKSRRQVGRNGSTNASTGASGINRLQIDESLRSIDETVAVPHKKLSRREKRRLKRAAHPRRHFFKKLITILLVLGVLGAIGYVGYRTFLASSNVFKGSIFDALQQEPLKQDSNGRSNILILGTSEDDPGHQAGNLTDSMMILSVDQNNKNAYMISIPRDLYVDYGVACDAGYRGRINVYYSCVTDGEGVEAQRAAIMKTAALVGDIFGLDIQYGVNLNYTVMRDVVNAVGGSINVTIESRDPRGQMDSNFDWKCGGTYSMRIANCPPSGHFIDYPNGEVTLDAEHTLYLAQARGDTAPTYGFEQSNFDREKNQQKIMVALREKAMSVGVLSDLGKVTGLINSLGDNLRTTFETREIKTLVSLANDIPSENIRSISLVDGEMSIMTTDNVGGQSVVVPSAGTYEYADLRASIREQLSSNPVTREKAAIVVLNGSGVGGVGQAQADFLEEAGYIVSSVDNAPDGTYQPVEIYQLDSTKTATADALKSLFGVTLKTTTPPVDVAAGTSFVVIYGQAPAASTTN